MKLRTFWSSISMVKKEFMKMAKRSENDIHTINIISDMAACDY